MARSVFSLLPLIPILWSAQTHAQLPENSELHTLLKSRDSLLFDAAFNRCDPETMSSLFTEDFEFYHDRGGVTLGRELFLEPVRKQCDSRNSSEPQPSKRILIEGSLEVFPLYKQGVLYGAIQHGRHRFESRDESGEFQRGDIARFTHIWRLEDGIWKISRELSYDHISPEQQTQSSSN